VKNYLIEIYFESCCIYIFLLIIVNTTLFAQQVRHTYRFYNNLSTTEPDCAPDLVPAVTLNTICLGTVGATPGYFVADRVPSNGITRNVYHNFQGWGLKYLNNTGVITQTYTVQLYVKITNFNPLWTRLD
jgi:hypothetical protein